MKTFTIILGLFLLPLNLLSQSVITVDNRENSGADYTNLSEAVAATIVGDTIQVHPSATSYGTVTINKRLVLVGMGHNPANSADSENATIGTVYLTGASADSEITGLQINVITTNGTITNVNNVKIINNYITSYVAAVDNANTQNWIIEGNIFNTGYVNNNGTNGWIVKNNIFYRNNSVIYNFDNTSSFLNNIVIFYAGGASVNFASTSTDPIVNNNVFILLNNLTDIVLSSSTVAFNNCLTRNVSGFTVTALPGSGNLDNIDPQFASAPFGTITDYYNNDYNVTNPSAINAGTDGTDLGIFGANFEFDVNGRPDLFPFMTSLNISNSSVPMGQNIEVTFTAEKKN